MATLSNEPDVTVIIVTMNRADLLRKCLEHIQGQNYSNINIIVVDNGSSTPVAQDCSDYSNVEFLRNPANTGFAAGNNKGIRAASGKYIALINNDAMAEPDWISSMVHTAERNPSAGAVASVVIDGNNPEVLDSCGVKVTADGMSRQAFKGAAIQNFRPPSETLAFSGCACLLRREALSTTGLFDPRFFAYCEDTDLSLRLRWQAWTITVSPEAKVKHYYSMTGGAHSLNKIFWVERNHFWVALKNFPPGRLWPLPLVTLYRFALQTSLARSGPLTPFIKANNRRKIAATIMQAHCSAFAGLPDIFRKRHSQMRKRTISTREMSTTLRKYRISMRQALGGK